MTIQLTIRRRKCQMSEDPSEAFPEIKSNVFTTSATLVAQFYVAVRLLNLIRALCRRWTWITHKCHQNISLNGGFIYLVTLQLKSSPNVADEVLEIWAVDMRKDFPSGKEQFQWQWRSCHPAITPHCWR